MEIDLLQLTHGEFLQEIDLFHSPRKGTPSMSRYVPAPRGAEFPHGDSSVPTHQGKEFFSELKSDPAPQGEEFLHGYISVPAHPGEEFFCGVGSVPIRRQLIRGSSSK